MDSHCVGTRPARLRGHYALERRSVWRKPGEQYSELIDLAIAKLTDGPSAVGAKHRDDIAPGLMTLHIARGRRRVRHLLLFRVAGHPGDRQIEVLRILHDAMDIIRHIPPGEA